MGESLATPLASSFAAAPSLNNSMSSPCPDDRQDVWALDEFSRRSMLTASGIGSGEGKSQNPNAKWFTITIADPHGVNIADRMEIDDTDDDDDDDNEIDLSSREFESGPGETITLKVPEDRYILFEAEDQGYELPYACRMGCCTACAVKVKSGSMKQTHLLGMSQALQKEGYA